MRTDPENIEGEKIPLLRHAVNEAAEEALRPVSYPQLREFVARARASIISKGSECLSKKHALLWWALRIQR
jgi:hypothetical protein